MPLNFPGLFPQTKGLLVNYDWVDLASGTGYVLYDGFKHVDSTGTTYALLESSKAPTVFGHFDGGTTNFASIFSQVTGNSGQSIDWDFDLTEFKFPKTLKGDAYFRISLATIGNNITGIVWTGIIRKWTGSVETDIVSVTSDTYTTNNPDTTSRTLRLVVPKTHFKKGEVLRFTLRLTTSNNNAYQVGHNPNDTAISMMTAGNSRMVVAIPYEITT